MKYKYLNMVTKDNHNKYYIMKENEDGKTFCVTYGRVGATGMMKEYPISRFDRIYNEKIAKGYTDQTSLHAAVEVISSDSRYAPISDESVRMLMDKLMRCANKIIEDNYTIKTEAVTQNMLQMARKRIGELARYCSNMTVDRFNQCLLEIYSIIPRKMNCVYDFLAKSRDDFSDIIQDEYDLLGVMSSQVSCVEKKDISTTSTTENKETLLDHLGLYIRPCTTSEIEKIKEKMDDYTRNLFSNAWYVRNYKQEEKYKNYCKKNHINRMHEHFLYHGSKSRNWIGIMSESFQLNPDAPITGKMFGYGLYFAPKARKSLGYTSIRGARYVNETQSKGYLAVYKVAYRKPLDVYEWKSNYNTYKERNIAATNNDALYAHAGKSLVNDEVIIYREDQAVLRYLVELEVA